MVHDIRQLGSVVLVMIRARRTSSWLITTERIINQAFERQHSSPKEMDAGFDLIRSDRP